MTGPIEDDDPGWGGFLPGLIALVPGGLHYLERRGGRSGQNPLVMLRGIFVASSFAVVMVGLVAALIAPQMSGEESLDALPVAIGVAVFGALTVGGSRAIERPFQCGPEELLVGFYRTRFFLRIAFAESAAMVGFVGVIACREAWVYAIGLMFAAVGFVRAAPTRANLDRDQEEITSIGCGTSLLAALQGATPSGGPVAS